METMLHYLIRKCKKVRDTEPEFDAIRELAKQYPEFAWELSASTREDTTPITRTTTATMTKEFTGEHRLCVKL